MEGLEPSSLYGRQILSLLWLPFHHIPIKSNILYAYNIGVSNNVNEFFLIWQNVFRNLVDALGLEPRTIKL